jgi:hypothetical protein
MQKEAAQAQGQEQQGGGRGKKVSPEEEKAKIKKMGAETERALAQARHLDMQGGSKIGELILDAFRTDADIGHKAKEHSHKQKKDTLDLLTALVPGMKQEQQPPNGGPPVQ